MSERSRSDDFQNEQTYCQTARARDELSETNESRFQSPRWRFTRPDAFAGRSSAVSVTSLAVLVLIGWLDYVTGYEFGFFIFYFIPVAISSWYCGRKLGLPVALGSALVWYLSDKFTHHPYSHSYFIYWEMFMRLLSFLTTTMTISRIRTMVLNEERLISELLTMKNELKSLKNDARNERDLPPNKP